MRPIGEIKKEIANLTEDLIQHRDELLKNGEAKEDQRWKDFGDCIEMLFNIQNMLKRY